MGTAYVAKTDSTHSKWWIINNGAARSRLHDLMIHDAPDGPYYTTAAASWTASAGDAAEYYHAPTKRPDNVYCAGTKLTEQADDTCIDGGGAGLANGQWCWMTASSRVYIQIAAGDPDGVTTSLYYDWNGGNSGTDFMTEVVEDGVYRFHLPFEVGDGSTATTLETYLECLFFDSMAAPCTLKASATLTSGVIRHNMGVNGSYWRFNPTSNFTWTTNGQGTFYLYGSLVQVLTEERLYIGTGTITDSVIQMTLADTGCFFYPGSGVTITRGYIGHAMTSATTNGTIELNGSAAMDGFITNARALSSFVTGTSLTFSDFTSLFSASNGLRLLAGSSNIAGNSISVKDVTASGYDTSTFFIGAAAGAIYLQYTVNIHVADKDGADLSGATVTWLDSQSNTGNDDTDVNGDVTFTLTAKQWVGTAETETNYNTFTFTITKAGYETLILQNITIDAPIDWHLELKGPVRHKVGTATYFRDDS